MKVWSGFSSSSDGKESACNAGDLCSIPGSGRMAIHSNVLAWFILWTEKPGRLQSVGSQRLSDTHTLDGKEGAKFGGKSDFPCPLSLQGHKAPRGPRTLSSTSI